jgi:transcriptional regulator with XRE-family HTH domain
MADWPKLLRELKDVGVTQTQIAEMAEVSQGTVSDLATGRREETSYRLGTVIDRLHDAHVKGMKVDGSFANDAPSTDGEGPRTPLALGTNVRPERDTIEQGER